MNPLRLIAWLIVGFCLGQLCVATVRAEDIVVEISATAAQRRLGNYFFFDRWSFSRNQNISCASCHNPNPRWGFSDSRDIAVGDLRFGRDGRVIAGLINARNTPSLINVGDRIDELVNWDGRVRGVRAMCMQAVTDRTVMAMPNVQAAVDRINTYKPYRDLAEIAYGRRTLTESDVRDCFVVFLSTIVCHDTPADKLARGEPSGLPAEAIEGWPIFETHCTSCHNPATGWRDQKWHNVGISLRSGNLEDLGRGAITGRPEDRHCFRTPDLTYVTSSTPFFHDGSVRNIDDAVEHFANGGWYQRNGKPERAKDTDPLVKAINVPREQRRALKTFVRLAFQGDYPVVENPFVKPKAPAAGAAR